MICSTGFSKPTAYRLVAGPHVVAAVHLQRLPAGAAGLPERQHAAGGVRHLVAQHPDLQPLVQAAAGAGTR
jgi:hypothetical protein